MCSEIFLGAKAVNLLILRPKGTKIHIKSVIPKIALVVLQSNITLHVKLIEQFNWLLTIRTQDFVNIYTLIDEIRIWTNIYNQESADFGIWNCHLGIFNA